MIAKTIKNVTNAMITAVNVAETVNASDKADAIIAPNEPINTQVPFLHTQ